jgi:ABC-type polysaccharide/polyol phosphate transport system ATPase subunit
MSNVAIRIEELGKKYHIGGKQKRYNRLGDQIAAAVSAPFRRAGNLLRGQHGGASDLDQEFWALKDISFEIKHGEIIGIIGHNGAGKSTLLKILSQITEPTTGYADVFGRVGSLLEVGTGFHPELTGRENVYLNGSILGMHRAEIDRKFDAIVDFASVEQFIDTPVKHYSSGMYVRLAFAVAAHLEPEILLIDEVLAVGDVAFQKKSLGKMEEVAHQGRTVIFVSHNMNALQRLCPTSILLDHGKLTNQGETSQVVEQYLSFVSSQSAGPDTWIEITSENRQGTGDIKFSRISYTSGNRLLGNHPYTNGPLEISLEIFSSRKKQIGSIAATIFDKYGTSLVNIDTLALGRTIELCEGINNIKLEVEQLHLNPGIYTLGLWAADPPNEIFDVIPSAALIEVVETEKQKIRVRSDGVVPVNFKVNNIT